MVLLLCFLAQFMTVVGHKHDDMLGHEIQVNQWIIYCYSSVFDTHVGFLPLQAFVDRVEVYTGSG